MSPRKEAVHQLPSRKEDATNPRSKTGCLTCKDRKVRCPEERPTCATCVRLNLNCEYGDARTGPRRPRSKYQSRGDRYLVRFVQLNQPSRKRKPASLNPISPSPSLDQNDMPSASGPGHQRKPSDISILVQGNDVELTDAQIPGPDEGSSLESAHGAQATQAELSSHLQPWYAANDAASEMFFQMLDLPDLQFSVDMDFDVNTDFGAQQYLDASGDLDFSPSSTQRIQNGGFGQVPTHLVPTQDLDPVPSDTSTAEDQSVNITPNDHRLIQHFLHSMKHYTPKLRQTSDENLNTEMFSNTGLFNAQAFHAMMAFAALHLSQTQKDFMIEAETRYQRATALLLQDEHREPHLDVTVITVWFLLQYELHSAKGLVRFCNLLAHLAHVLDRYYASASSSAALSTLSVVGSRTLVSISTYDVRALSSGGGGGYLLKSLQNFLPLRRHIREPISNVHRASLIPHREAFPGHYDPNHINTLRLRFRTNLLQGRILMLLANQQDNGDIEAAQSAWHETRIELLELHDVIERTAEDLIGFPVGVATGKIMRLPGNLSSLRSGQLMTLSSLYATFLDYHQSVRAAARLGLDVSLNCLRSTCPCRQASAFPSSAECAARIVRIAHFVSLHQPRGPQFLWPSLLFIAGVESEDSIHREWILNHLSGTETWAPHFLKTRTLLESILLQNLPAKMIQADVLAMQSQVTGAFVI